MALLDLPPEILSQIFENVPGRDLLSCREVCHHVNQIITTICGLHVKLEKTSRGNRAFAKAVHINSLQVKNMSQSHEFTLKSLNALKKLVCAGPVNCAWFTEEVLRLQNLTVLKLHEGFFYLQEIPLTTSSSYLPNLTTLVAHIPAKFQRVSPPPSCTAFPAIEATISQRIAKNMCVILKTVKSPKLCKVEFVDDFPRCINTAAQWNQWCGQVMADFIGYHRYSLKSFHLKKVFIPWPEDPFTTEDNNGYPELESLNLHISGTDVGTFHYWRALIEAQQKLKALELKISGAFWHRFPVLDFINQNKETLKHLDLSLDYDMEDRGGSIQNGGFDFQCVTQCCHLQSLKIGPCGFLTPTKNFSLVPRLLNSLTSLQLTFLNITNEELLLIANLGSLKSLKLRCLVKAVGNVISSPVNLSLLKRYVSIRSLDTLGLDFITTSDTKAVSSLAMRMHGKHFKGNGFFFPYELEDQVMISGDSLRAAPSGGPGSNVSGEDEEQCRGYTFRDIVRHLDGDEGGGRDSTNNSPFQCACVTRPRVRRRNARCISRYCIPAMADICEDLMRAEKPELWDAYADGSIGFEQIKLFIPEASSDVGAESLCQCDSEDSSSESEGGSSLGVAMETLFDNRRNDINKNEKNGGESIGTNFAEKTTKSSQLITRHGNYLTELKSVLDESNFSANMAAVAIGEPAEILKVIHSKDWFTQTELERQDSMDVMTQYENQRLSLDFKCNNQEFRLYDSSSQTDILHAKVASVTSDISVQKDIQGSDIAIQKETQGTDCFTQHAVEVKDSSSQDDVHCASIGLQIETIAFNMEAQTVISMRDRVDIATQIESSNKEQETQCAEVKRMNVSTQGNVSGDEKGTQIGSIGHDKEVCTTEIKSHDQECQHEAVSTDQANQTDFIGIEKHTEAVPDVADGSTQYECNVVAGSSQSESVTFSDAATEVETFVSSSESQTTIAQTESTGFQVNVDFSDQSMQAVATTNSIGTQSEAVVLTESSFQTMQTRSTESIEIQVALPLSNVNKETQYEPEPQAKAFNSSDENGNDVSTQYEVPPESKLNHVGSQWEGPSLCQKCRANVNSLGKPADFPQKKTVDSRMMAGNESELTDLEVDDHHAFGDATLGRKKKRAVMTSSANNNGAVRRYCVIS